MLKKKRNLIRSIPEKLPLQAFLAPNLQKSASPSTNPLWCTTKTHVLSHTLIKPYYSIKFKWCAASGPHYPAPTPHYPRASPFSLFSHYRHQNSPPHLAGKFQYSSLKFDL